MIILGIGGLLGDAAAAVLKDGELAAAVEESKLVRRRTHWGGLDEMPEHAISTCLALAGAKPEQVDAVLRALPHEWDTYRTSYSYLEVHGQCRKGHDEDI